MAYYSHKTWKKIEPQSDFSLRDPSWLWFIAKFLACEGKELLLTKLNERGRDFNTQFVPHEFQITGIPSEFPDNQDLEKVCEGIGKELDKRRDTTVEFAGLVTHLYFDASTMSEQDISDGLKYLDRIGKTGIGSLGRRPKYDEDFISTYEYRPENPGLFFLVKHFASGKYGFNGNSLPIVVNGKTRVADMLGV